MKSYLIYTGYRIGSTRIEKRGKREERRGSEGKGRGREGKRGEKRRERGKSLIPCLWPTPKLLLSIFLANCIEICNINVKHLHKYSPGAAFQV